jgi:hypothetical protein
LPEALSDESSNPKTIKHNIEAWHGNLSFPTASGGGDRPDMEKNMTGLGV